MCYKADIFIYLFNFLIIPSLYYLNKQYISRICWETKSFNFHKDEDQQKIYDYLKEKLIRFDKFYQEYKEILIALTN